MTILAAYSMADMENLRYANFRKTRSDKGKKRGTRVSKQKMLPDDGTGRYAGSADARNYKINKFKNFVEKVKGNVKSDLRNAKQILKGKERITDVSRNARGVRSETYRMRGLGVPITDKIGRGPLYKTEKMTALKKAGALVKHTGVGKVGAGLAAAGVAGAGYGAYRAMKNRNKKR